jgi:lysozyme family protein
MSERFSECLAETLKWEGGYSNDKYDPGGATMKGVIQRVYDAYREGKGISRRPVKQIEEVELLDIYRRDYWNLVRGDEMPAGLDLALFDFGVNSGTGTATGKLQGVLGVAVDHQMGPVTLQAACNCDVPATIKKLQDSRRKYVRQIKTYWRFGKGWESRIKGVEAAALAMVGQVPKTAPPMPIPDADAQSVSQGRAIAVPVAMWFVRAKQTVGALLFGGSAYAAGTGGPAEAPTAPPAPVEALPQPPDMAWAIKWQFFGETVSGLGKWCWHHWEITLLIALWVLGTLFWERIKSWLGWRPA